MKFWTHHFLVQLAWKINENFLLNILLAGWFPRKNLRQHNSIYNVYYYWQFYFTMDDRITIWRMKNKIGKSV